MKSPIYWVKKVGTGKPPPPYCDKIPTKSPCGFGLNKLGIGSDPCPPLLGWEKISSIAKNLV